MASLSRIINGLGCMTALAIYYAVLAFFLGLAGIFLFDEWYPNYSHNLIPLFKASFGAAKMNDMAPRIWEGIFEYESMVYVSTETFASTRNNVTLFFEQAQVLWHVNPQTTTGKRQLSTQEISILLTQEFKKTGQLYAHIFVQKASKLSSKHPNVLDPEIKYYSEVLLRYSGANSSQVVGLEEYNVYVDVLDMSGESTHETKPLSRSDTPPSPYSNICGISDNVVIAEEVAAIHGKGQAERLNVAIGIEIKPANTVEQLYQNATFGLGILVSTRVIVRNITTADISDPTKTLTRIFKSNVADFEEEHPDQQQQGLSQEIITFVYRALTIVFGCIVMRINIGFWLSSRAQTVGVSRAAAALYIIQWYFEYLVNIADYTDYSDMPYLIYGTFSSWIMARNLRLSIIPWRALSQAIEGASGSSYVEEKSKLDTSKLQRNSINQFKQETLIIYNREQVDRVVAQWIRLLLAPVVAVVAVYISWFKYNGLWSIPAIVGQAMTLCGSFSSFLDWLPQIAINYKCKAGNFTPVSLHLIKVGAILLTQVYHYLCGSFQNLFLFSLEMMSVTIHLVLVVQWVIYRKIKHE